MALATLLGKTVGNPREEDIVIDGKTLFEDAFTANPVPVFDVGALDGHPDVIVGADDVMVLLPIAATKELAVNAVTLDVALDIFKPALTLDDGKIPLEDDNVLATTTPCQTRPTPRSTVENVTGIK